MSSSPNNVNALKEQFERTAREQEREAQRSTQRRSPNNVVVIKPSPVPKAIHGSDNVRTVPSEHFDDRIHHVVRHEYSPSDEHSVRSTTIVDIEPLNYGRKGKYIEETYQEEIRSIKTYTPGRSPTGYIDRVVHVDSSHGLNSGPMSRSPSATENRATTPVKAVVEKFESHVEESGTPRRTPIVDTFRKEIIRQSITTETRTSGVDRYAEEERLRREKELKRKEEEERRHLEEIRIQEERRREQLFIEEQRIEEIRRRRRLEQEQKEQEEVRKFEEAERRAKEEAHRLQMLRIEQEESRIRLEKEEKIRQEKEEIEIRRKKEEEDDKHRKREEERKRKLRDEELRFKNEETRIRMEEIRIQREEEENRRKLEENQRKQREEERKQQRLREEEDKRKHEEERLRKIREEEEISRIIREDEIRVQLEIQRKEQEQLELRLKREEENRREKEIRRRQQDEELRIRRETEERERKERVENEIRKRQAEKERRQREQEERRIEDEHKRAEERRRIEEIRIAEERRIIEQTTLLERRQIEEERRTNEKLENDRKEEELRRQEERLRQERQRLEEERRREQERLDKQRLEAEQKLRIVEQRRIEEKLRQQELIINEEKRIEELRAKREKAEREEREKKETERLRQQKERELEDQRRQERLREEQRRIKEEIRIKEERAKWEERRKVEESRRIAEEKERQEKKRAAEMEKVKESADSKRHTSSVDTTYTTKIDGMSSSTIGTGSTLYTPTIGTGAELDRMQDDYRSTITARPGFNRQNINNYNSSTSTYGGAVSGNRVLKIVNEVSSSTLSGLSPFGQHAASAIRDAREREKKEMSDLNDRLASYIEKVRFLEAQNRKLGSDLDLLRSKWGKDTSSIRTMYESELSEARKLIADTNRQRDDIEKDIRRLMDELADYRRKYETAFSSRDSDRLKIDDLLIKLSALESEINLLKRRISNLEDEVSRIKKDNHRLLGELQRARQDLDQETLNRIDYQNQVQTLLEEIDFIRRVNEQEIRDLQAMASRDTTSENREYFKNELSSAIRDIREEYDQISSVNRNDMESWYKLKVQEIHTQSVRTNMEQGYAKEEVKRLRVQLGDLRGKLTDLEGRNSLLEKQIQELNYQLEDDQRSYESALNDRDAQIRKMREECQALMVELQMLLDTKQTLDAEIAIYRKMLEGEENRAGLRQLVEQVVKTTGLAHSEEHESMRVLKGETASRTSFQRSAKGNVSIQETSPDGKFIVLENTHRSRDESLGDWKLKRKIDGKREIVYTFPPNFVLRPSHSVKIFARGHGIHGPNTLVHEGDDSFGTGMNVQTTLFNSSGEERATHIQRSSRD